MLVMNLSLLASDLSGSLSVTPATLSAQIPLATFEFNGCYYGETNSVIKETGAIDRTSPQTLARSLFKALSDQDVDLYANIYKTPVSEVTYSARKDNAVNAMQIISEIKYGDLDILLIHIEMKSGQVEWVQPYYMETTTQPSV